MSAHHGPYPLVGQKYRSNPKRNRSKRQRSLYRFPPRLEVLEDRLAPTVNSSVLGSTLTVTLSAAGDAATINGTGIAGSFTVSGTPSFTGTMSPTGIDTIVVNDTGSNASQSLTLNGSSA